MAETPHSLSKRFQRIAPASPDPFSYSRAFSRYASRYQSPVGNTSLSDQVQQLASEVAQQGSTVADLASAVSGGGSALQNAGSNLLGGSVLGGVASSAASGFSWQSIVKDILPFGGLISGIAGLFSSPATPAPLQQYDAPVSLNFDGVLGSNGQISQGSSSASGQERASSPGLDLTDASGGPQSPYQRAADGSLKDVAGSATSRYSGTLDLSSTVQNLVSAAAPSPAAQPAKPSVYGDGQNANAPAPAAPPAADATSAAADPAAALPSFDGPWFMDRAPYIAAAVRSAMLDYHPVVDVVNDL